MEWVIEGYENENDKGKRCVDRGVQKTGRTGEEQTKMDNRKMMRKKTDIESPSLT